MKSHGKSICWDDSERSFCIVKQPICFFDCVLSFLQSNANRDLDDKRGAAFQSLRFFAPKSGISLQSGIYTVNLSFSMYLHACARMHARTHIFTFVYACRHTFLYACRYTRPCIYSCVRTHLIECCTPYCDFNGNCKNPCHEPVVLVFGDQRVADVCSCSLHTEANIFCTGVSSTLDQSWTRIHKSAARAISGRARGFKTRRLPWLWRHPLEAIAIETKLQSKRRCVHFCSSKQEEASPLASLRSAVLVFHEEFFPSSFFVALIRSDSGEAQQHSFENSGEAHNMLQTRSID